MGNENLNKPEIQNAIREAIQKRSERTVVTQDRVIGEIGKVAFRDASDYQVSDLKYSNKLKALELLGKHLGMFDSKATQEPQESNLLQAITDSAQEDLDTDDLPEI